MEVSEKNKLKACEIYHAAVALDPAYVPENSQANYSLNQGDPLPATPYYKRKMLFELLTHEGWWAKLRAGDLPDREREKIRDLMLERWKGLHQQGVKDEEPGTGRGTASTGAGKGGGAKRKATSSTEGQPKVKRQVDEDDL